MAKKINILVVEPGQPPRPAQVEATLKTFEKVVGGPVEIGCFLPQRVLLIGQEDGKQRGLPPNRENPQEGDYIAGTFMLCGFEDDSFISLTPAQQMEFQSRFAKPGEFMMIDADKVCARPEELVGEVCRLWNSLPNGQSVVLTKWGGPERGVTV